MANNKIAFGLCEQHNIKLPKDATPRDAWEALKERGIVAGDDSNAKSSSIIPGKDEAPNLEQSKADYDINSLTQEIESDISNAAQILRRAITDGKVNTHIHKGHQDKQADAPAHGRVRLHVVHDLRLKASVELVYVDELLPLVAEPVLADGRERGLPARRLRDEVRGEDVEHQAVELEHRHLRPDVEPEDAVRVRLRVVAGEDPPDERVDVRDAAAEAEEAPEVHELPVGDVGELAVASELEGRKVAVQDLASVGALHGQAVRALDDPGVRRQRVLEPAVRAAQLLVRGDVAAEQLARVLHVVDDRLVVAGAGLEPEASRHAGERPPDGGVREPAGAPRDPVEPVGLGRDALREVRW